VIGLKLSIKGNQEEIIRVLDMVRETAEKEGGKIKDSKKMKIISAVSKLTPTPVNLSDFDFDISLSYFREGEDSVLLTIPAYVPKAFRMGGIMKGKIESSFKEVFDACNVSVKIKFLSWE
jgi:hypothetical protein